MENENLITYNNVLIRQGEYDIVKDVTLSVNKGDFVYIIGPVGSGKSSILRTLYADLKISGGNCFRIRYVKNQKKAHSQLAKKRRNHLSRLQAVKRHEYSQES